MIKKTKLFALALAIVLCLSIAQVAFAANGTPITGSEATPAQAAISKVLKLPEGTIVPTANFTFNVTAKSVDGDATAPALATAPVIGSLGVVTIALPGTPSSNTTASNTTTYVVESANLFAGATFPHAGIYEYEITENGSTYNIADPTKETLTYSGAKYTLTAFVEEGTGNGVPVGQYYVKTISALVETEDHPGTPGGDKVDPTPGSSNSNASGYSQLIFTNEYTKTNGGTDPKNSSTLNLSKTVAGQYASKTMYFVYSLTVTKPALVTGTPVYKAYVVDTATNTVVTSADNGATAGPDTYGSYINFSSGVATEVKLKDGQKLVFIDTPVGTTYLVTETGTLNYTPSAVVTTDAATNSFSAGANAALAIPIQIVGDVTTPGNINLAAFTNTRGTVTPTGINLSEMPYVGMIVLAVVALGAYIAVKARKKASN
jgi:hypothetical protein